MASSSMNLSCKNNIKRTNGSSRPPVPIYSDSVFIGDRSGSMYNMNDAPIEGVSNFLRKNKDLYDKNGGEINVTIITFDDKVEIPFSGNIKNLTEEDIQRCKDAMVPRNTTRLYDTAIEAIEEQSKRIKKNDNPLFKYALSLLTDGQDNVSKNTPYNLSESINKHKKLGVTCQFLAANQDAISTGNKYGFDSNMSMQVTSEPGYAKSAFNACTDNLIRATTSGTDGFTPLERIASATDSDRNSLPRVGKIGVPKLQRV